MMNVNFIFITFTENLPDSINMCGITVRPSMGAIGFTTVDSTLVKANK